MNALTSDNSVNITNKEISGNGQSNQNVVKKKIYITGDIMAKLIKEWNLSNKLDENYNAHVQNVLRGNVRSLKDYIKPCIGEENPDYIILHVGTNDFNSEKNGQLIEKSVTDLAKGIANDKSKI